MARTLVYPGGSITLRSKLYASATLNEKCEEGAADGFLSRPNAAGFYRIPEFRAAYERGFAYGAGHELRPTAAEGV